MPAPTTEFLILVRLTSQELQDELNASLLEDNTWELIFLDLVYIGTTPSWFAVCKRTIT